MSFVHVSAISPAYGESPYKYTANKLNDEYIAHYQIPNIAQGKFRMRVSRPTDRRINGRFIYRL